MMTEEQLNSIMNVFIDATNAILEEIKRTADAQERIADSLDFFVEQAEIKKDGTNE